ncbi:hypothetical protein AMTRI_Chr03g50910 [Amborella trichopoda]
MEKTIIFDFNLTLPITGELLLLMNSVRDTSKEVKEAQAAAMMSTVSAEMSWALNQMKREVIMDLEVKMVGVETIKAIDSEIAALTLVEIMKNDMDKKLLVSCDHFGVFLLPLSLSQWFVNEG